MTCQDCTAIKTCPRCVATRRAQWLTGCDSQLASIYASLAEEGIALADIDEETRESIAALVAERAEAVAS